MGSSIHLDVYHLPHYLHPLFSVDPKGSCCLCPIGASRDYSDIVALQTPSGDFFSHHGLLHRRRPSNPCSCVHTSKIISRYTHCTTLPWLQKMYVAAVCIPSALNTSPDAGVAHVLSVVLHALLPMICLSNNLHFWRCIFIYACYSVVLLMIYGNIPYHLL